MGKSANYHKYFEAFGKSRSCCFTYRPPKAAQTPNIQLDFESQSSNKRAQRSQNEFFELLVRDRNHFSLGRPRIKKIVSQHKKNCPPLLRLLYTEVVFLVSNIKPLQPELKVSFNSFSSSLHLLPVMPDAGWELRSKQH